MADKDLRLPLRKACNKSWQCLAVFWTIQDYISTTWFPENLEFMKDLVNFFSLENIYMCIYFFKTLIELWCMRLSNENIYIQCLHEQNCRILLLASKP